MLEDIRLSFKGIWSHKMRSFLTMLGIIVGIAAVIAVVSTIEGTNEQIKNNLIGDGSNTVTIQLYQNGWPADFSYTPVPSGVPELTAETREELLKLDGVSDAALFHKRDYGGSLFYQNNSMDGCSVLGVDDSYFDAAGMRVIKGRGFTASDLKPGRKSIVIDKTALSSWWEGDDPLGSVVDVNGEPFTVIGVADKKTAFEPVINSMEDYYTYMQTSSGAVYIPDTEWPVVFQYDEPRAAIIRAASTDEMTTAGRAATDLLNSKLTISQDASSEETIKYQSANLADEASELQQLSASSNILLIGIASISLLVGGIGVMNIMLVSVTERTREIGLKKALGAKKRRIRSQFLLEAMILSGIGGVLGVIAGVILSRIISAVAMIPVAISIPSIIIAVLFSMAIGILFGMIPSIKASNLNPIEALGYE